MRSRTLVHDPAKRFRVAGRYNQTALPAFQRLDHDDFGSIRSKIMNVIDSNKLEHDVVRTEGPH
jgi:hypothetical protein